ncbi:hypothetical protein BJY00DRAFT_315327 [Aspergillus carlsbadensis]|nr:hypothetical protein BJY00DRAFT_315327 [Aspergillus carlsbadensis]
MSLVRGDTADYAKTQYGRLAPSSGSFDNLPLELVEAIALFLDVATLCALRATCRFLTRCTHYYFMDRCLHTASIDFSKAALRRVRRLARHPESASMITTLVVTPGDCRLETAGFGAGLNWKRAGHGALDLNQPAVRDWVNALRCLVNCRAVRTSSRRVCRLNFQWTSERPTLKDYEALAIAMLFIKVARIPVALLDLHTVDIWERDHCYETFPKQKHLDHVFPVPSPRRRTRSPPWAQLQSLSLTNKLYIDHGDRFAALLASARALKSLKLAGVPASFDFNVLSARANRFRLEHLELSCMHHLPANQLPAFLNALRTSRRTLKSLALSDSTLSGPAH